jgi:hypothetical protein
MNDQPDSDEFDPKLEAFFKREHTHVSAEPFLAATLRAVAAAGRRAGRVAERAEPVATRMRTRCLACVQRRFSARCV